MSGDAITRYRPDPVRPHVTDWSEADKLSEEEIRARALSDPDAQPVSAEQLACARRLVDVRRIRERLGLSQEEFALGFGLRLELVAAWEDRSVVPDGAAITLLRVIAADPEAVRRVVAAE